MDTMLIVVDAQNDFFEDGSLPVPDASEIIPVINNLQYENIIYTKDCHPPNHSSFKEFGGIWPSHCVKGSHGYLLHNDIIKKDNCHIIHKGYNKDKDSYSAFYIDGEKETPLNQLLQKLGVKNIYFCGLAYEYCVYETVMDAVKFGYNCYLIENATRGICPETILDRRNIMVENGVVMV